MDGYLADKNHQLDWLYQTGSVEVTDYDVFYNQMDIVIMGKKTFNAIKDLDNLDEIYPTTTNYVFTHEPNLHIAGFNFVSGSVVDFIKQQDTAKNIWIVGGNTLLAPLLEKDLVDVLKIQVAPVLLGDGIPLFTKSDSLQRFELEDVTKYGPFAALSYHKSV
ncbi:dihydrofolate reductase [Lactococcus piscium]|uniref:Dihydrofolate reductase n=1 Tax=Pseudolactococcus piscium TaxID=1364 RepID=A0A2A5RW19_9LACT|nr:dihydrofolate reductase [Lactococcus piscium]